MKTRYMIITEEQDGKLECKVDEYLEQGWQLQGGVSMCAFHVNGELRILYSQAMVKEEPT